MCGTFCGMFTKNTAIINVVLLWGDMLWDDTQSVVTKVGGIQIS